ncbi:MAG: hypothetical protein ACRCZB_05010 [Bacteroidales bacterium]
MEKEITITKRIPPSVRGTIYEKFAEAVAEELFELKKEILETKTSFFDVSKMDRKRLIAVSETFGVPFFSFISDDINFLRKEVENIGFKLFYKGTPILYKSFFLTINRVGEMFIYTYQSFSKSLKRSIVDPLSVVRKSAPNLPFKIDSKNDFSGIVENYVRLDTGLFIDSYPSWYLDTSSSEISSNHIGLEYYIDRLISKKNKEFLMTTEYFSFLSKNFNWARRCKEVPHVGAQLSVQTDTTGFKNFKYPEQEYSVPVLKLDVVGSPTLEEDISSKLDILYAKFGVGKHNLPKVGETMKFPDDLAQSIAVANINSHDTYEDGDYIGATSEYIGQEIKNIDLKRDFDGVETSFSFVIPMSPIRKGNVCLRFTTSDGEIYETLDDKRGKFLSEYAIGTINYETGECKLSTKFEYPASVVITEEAKQEDPSVWAFTLHKAEETPLKKGRLKIAYVMGTDKRAYEAIDDGEGSFISPAGTIVASTINYETGEIEIRFNTQLSDDSFLVEYVWDVSWVPTIGTLLSASYFFVFNTIEITEFGLYSGNKKLLAYATFPPIEFSSTEFHCNFTILVKKT